MFRTIVCAVDGSEDSERGLALATELARESNGRIVIAHVEQDVVGKGGGPIPATEDEIQAEVRKKADDLSKQGIETDVQMRTIMLGGPAHSIVEIADREGADLIVVGSRGHTPFGELLLGSVTHRLLHMAHQPVLVAPRSQRAGNGVPAHREEHAAA